jgi:hypothetical protein
MVSRVGQRGILSLLSFELDRDVADFERVDWSGLVAMTDVPGWSVGHGREFFGLEAAGQADGLAPRLRADNLVGSE